MKTKLIFIVIVAFFVTYFMLKFVIAATMLFAYILFWACLAAVIAGTVWFVTLRKNKDIKN